MADHGCPALVQDLLATGRWEQARTLLADLLADQESAEALAGMGTALWWLGHVRESLSHRERAFAAYRAEGKDAEAAIVALDVSVTYLSNLDNPAVARGWIARARRAAELSGDAGLRGWLRLMEGYTADDPIAGRQLLESALTLGRERRDVDLELAALADLGLSMVVGGDVADGLALLDEAMAGTLGGECRRLDTVVWASCSMLAACALAGDQQRAAQWCAAADRFSQKYGCPFLQARCRSHYGRLLVAAGRWQLAEAELNTALSMSAGCGRAPRVEALVGLAELRLRQGAVEEAELLLAEAAGGREALLVTAEVMIARGSPERAVAVLATELETMGQRELDYPALAARLVDAYLANGDDHAASVTALGLQGSAHHQHPQVLALTERASGRVAAARGQVTEAAARLSCAAIEYERLELPFEAARTRFELAQAIEGIDPSRAVVEAGRAFDGLQRIGAHRAAAAVAAFLRRLGVATRPGPRQMGLLSQRERDVLALVRLGLTNPEIAAELFISPRTVAHHVSSILAKLGLRSRTEVAAFAVSVQGPAGESDAGDRRIASGQPQLAASGRRRHHYGGHG